MLVVLLISILAWAPLLYPGLVQTQSGLGAIYDALALQSPLSGWLPASATPGTGPLATWLLAALHAVTSWPGALDVLYAASFIVGGLGVYILARRLWGVVAAMAASVVYMLLPYLLTVVYVRGDRPRRCCWPGRPGCSWHCAPPSAAAAAAALWLSALLMAILALLNFGLALVVAVLGLAWTRWRRQRLRCPRPISRLPHL